jgi:hypothetical protein
MRIRIRDGQIRIGINIPDPQHWFCKFLKMVQLVFDYIFIYVFS